MTDYSVLSWNTMPLFQCRLCPYDTLDEAEMIQHQTRVHTPVPAPAVVQVQVLDRFGNVVEGEMVDVVVATDVVQQAESKRGKRPKEDVDGENHAI
jgi:hypothetical protein